MHAGAAAASTAAAHHVVEVLLDVVIDVIVTALCAHDSGILCSHPVLSKLEECGANVPSCRNYSPDALGCVQ